MNASVRALSTSDALACIASSLRLADTKRSLSPSFVAQALRRAIQVLAPCSRAALERAVYRSLTGLGNGDEEVGSLTEETLESLLVYGEILEMRPDPDDIWGAGPFVLRPAPPSFVIGSNGAAILIGVAGEEITPLPAHLDARVEHAGVLRVLRPEPNEHLRDHLQELGLIELTEQVWLRLPARAAAKAYLSEWQSRLAGCPASGPIEGLKVLDTARPVLFYPDRWTSPGKSHTGAYVCRRPQKYGKDLWCLVELLNGNPLRLLDITSQGDRLRPCDIAWRIQMAIDADTGTPQRFRIRGAETHSKLDFFSPVPSWLERKLTVAGMRTLAERCLLSYSLPASGLDQEVIFIRERLWMAEHQEQ